MLISIKDILLLETLGYNSLEFNEVYPNSCLTSLNQSVNIIKVLEVAGRVRVQFGQQYQIGRLLKSTLKDVN